MESIPVLRSGAARHIGFEVGLRSRIDIAGTCARVVEMRSLDRVQNFLDQRALKRRLGIGKQLPDR